MPTREEIARAYAGTWHKGPWQRRWHLPLRRLTPDGWVAVAAVLALLLVIFSGGLR